MSAITRPGPISALRLWLEPLLAPRVRSYAALAFCIDASLVFVLFVAVQTYLPAHHNTSAALAGYVLASYGVAKLAGQLSAGWITDRITPKRALIVGLGLACVGQLAMLLGTVRSEGVLPAAGLYGIAGALVWPAIFAIAAADFPEDERARFSSGMTLATGAAVASALGLAMLLPADFPFEAAVIVGLLGTICALAVARMLSPATALSTPEANDKWQAWPLIRAVIAPQRLAFSLIILLQAAILGALLAVFRSYGANILHVSFRQELLLLIPAGAAGALAVLAGGALADRVGRIPVLGTGYLVVTFSVWGMSTTGTPGAVIPLSLMAAVGLAIALPCTGALTMDLAKSAGTGTLLGWFMTMEGAGHAAGPAVAGLLNEKGGTATALWLVGGLAAAVAIVALVPPFWARGGSTTRERPRAWALLSGTAKGALVFGVAFPVVATYLAWDPSSQLYGSMITHGPRDQMEVAISFDDGPNDPWTLRIADVLDQYGIEGAFFVVGQNASVHPEIVRQLVEGGNLIGNHSYHHRKRDVILDPNYSDLWEAETAIASAAGVCPALYRPPNGFHTPWQLHAVSSHGMKTITWDVIPRDWKDPPPSEIVSRVLDSVRPGSIILLHDGDDTNQTTDRSATLAALPGIIDGLRERGYSVVRLDRLLGVPGYLPTCDGLKEASS